MAPPSSRCRGLRPRCLTPRSSCLGEARLIPQPRRWALANRSRRARWGPPHCCRLPPWSRRFQRTESLPRVAQRQARQRPPVATSSRSSHFLQPHSNPAPPVRHFRRARLNPHQEHQPVPRRSPSRRSPGAGAVNRRPAWACRWRCPCAARPSRREPPAGRSAALPRTARSCSWRTRSAPGSRAARGPCGPGPDRRASSDRGPGSPRSLGAARPTRCAGACTSPPGKAAAGPSARRTTAAAPRRRPPSWPPRTS